MGRTHSVRDSYQTQEDSLKRFCGSSPCVLAEYYDLTRTNLPEAALDPLDISEEGFCKFMEAHNWAWGYSKTPKPLGRAGNDVSKTCMVSQFGI
jgi:hypothetical protein